MTISGRTLSAKNRIHKIKLEAIAAQLEIMDDAERANGLSKSEDILYDELVKSYRGTAIAWIKFRKSHDQPVDMIAVNWS